MPVQPKPVPISFIGAGLETKLDPKAVPPTRVLDLQNAVMTSGSFAKRNGYRALGLSIEGSISSVSGGVGLAARDDELLVFDGVHCYSRREVADEWSDAGEVACPTMSDRPIARTGTQQTMPTHATANGLTAIAWEDNRGGVWYSLVDATTGRIVVADTQLDALGQQPLCMPCGTRIHILWAAPLSKAIYIVVVDTAQATPALTPSVLVSDLSSTLPYYDACFATSSSPNYTGDGCVIAWVVDGTAGLKIGYVTSSGVLGAAINGFPIVGSYPAAGITGPVSVAYDRVNNVAIGASYFAGSGTVTSLVVQAAAPGTLIGGVPVIGSIVGSANRIACEFDPTGQVWTAAESALGAVDTSTINVGAITAAGALLIDGTTRFIRGHCLTSRAFCDGSNVSVAITHPVKFFPYVAVVRMSASTWGARVITEARILPGQSTGARPRAVLPTVNAIDGNSAGIGRVHEFATGVRIQLDSANGDQFGEAGIRLVSLNYADPDAYQCAQLGRGLYMAGALMQHYDGNRWAEAGFHCAPDTANGPPAGSDIGSGGSIGAGTYGYMFNYEEIDNEGEIHRGPMSDIVDVVVGGASHSVSFNVPTCRLTSKKNVRIAVWRSKNGDQSQFFRCTSLDPNASSGNNRFILNDPTVSTAAFVDGFDDATLGTKEPAYTNGGILGNDPTTCAGGAIVSGKNRLFWTDPSDPHIVRYSQPLTEDEAMNESAGLFQRVDPYGGGIVALAVMDDAVIVFKETAIYRFVGPGPDQDGTTTQDAFSPAQLITSDVGCSSPRSVVQGPVGVMFHSSKGIGLLGRDGQVVMQVGDPVYAYKDQDYVRATLLPDRHQILFLTDTDDGRTLLFDYEHQQWSTFTNHVGVDGVVSQGVYHYLRPDGRLFRETPGIYADDNAHIPMRIETAWIKFLPYLQGWQRVLFAQFLGTYKSPHTLGVRYRIDYQDAWSTQYQLDVNSNYNPSLYGAGAYGAGAYGGSGGADTVYQRRIHLNQRCQSIQFRIEDIEDTGVFGAAFELSELLLIGGILAPAFKLGADRSA